MNPCFSILAIPTCLKYRRRCHGLMRKVGISVALAVTIIVLSFKFVPIRQTLNTIFLPPDLKDILSDFSPKVQEYVINYEMICKSYNGSVQAQSAKRLTSSPNNRLLHYLGDMAESSTDVDRNLLHYAQPKSFNSTQHSMPVSRSPSRQLQSVKFGANNTGNRKENLDLCPCIPLEMFELNIGALDKYMSAPWVQIENLNSDVIRGGKWQPEDCVARHHVAIITPYRNREQHLKAFLSVMHPFLQRQYLQYQIFVIEQKAPEIFNRASLMNIGFLEAKKQGPFDCYIYHDVDLLPEMILNFYTCYKSPLHIGAYMNKFGYRMPYLEFFGGAVALTSSQMELIDGFSNRFYGWGGEDDDMYERLSSNHLTIYKHPIEIGKTYMLNHTQDKLNPVNPLRFQFIKKLNTEDGLSTLNYKQQTTTEKLFTRVLASIKPLFEEACVVDKRLPITAPGNYLDCYHEDNFLDGSLICCRDNSLVFCCNNMPSVEFSLQIMLHCLIILLVLCSFILAVHWKIRQSGKHINNEYQS